MLDNKRDRQYLGYLTAETKLSIGVINILESQIPGPRGFRCRKNKRSLEVHVIKVDRTGDIAYKPYFTHKSKVHIC